jgi:hypothetical protein
LPGVYNVAHFQILISRLVDVDISFDFSELANIILMLVLVETKLYLLIIAGYVVESEVTCKIIQRDIFLSSYKAVP